MRHSEELFRERKTDRLVSALCGSTWPARFAYAMGFQRKLLAKEHDVEVHGYPEDRPPLRIAFASDFHAGPTTHPHLLSTACMVMGSAEPDVLLLGGDYVSFKGSDVDALAEELGQIPAKFGKYAVLGNHDILTEEAHIVSKLESCGIHVLMNSNVRLAPPFDHVWICGLDDPCHGKPDPEAALRGADGNRVVIMHAPDGILHLENSRYDLALCGHTHGGQVSLPGGRPIVLPKGDLCRKYSRGRHQMEGAEAGTLIVTCGVGCMTLPFRLFADSEVLICNLGVLER